MTGQELNMLNIGKLMAKDQNYYKLMKVLMILIQSYHSLKLKALISKKELLNLAMYKNSNTKTKEPGKRMLYHMMKLKNLKTFIV